MTNLLKTLLAVTFLGITTLTLFAQQKVIRIVTTQKIEASSTAAFDLLRDFERFPEWSPFVVADPEQKNYVTGKTGQIGSAFHWEGVAEKSEGKQTLTALKDNEYLRMECEITILTELYGKEEVEKALAHLKTALQLAKNEGDKCLIQRKIAALK